jgi:hypothetical protein
VQSKRPAKFLQHQEHPAPQLVLVQAQVLVQERAQGPDSLQRQPLIPFVVG